MTPEGEIVRAVLDYLHASGVMAWRMNTGRRGGVVFGFAGLADILGIMPDGRMVAIECKTKAGKLTDDQREFLASVQYRGGVAGVARGIEDVPEILSGRRPVAGAAG